MNNNHHEFLENKEGVHLMYGEFTLCGDSFDIAETEEDFPDGPLVATSKKIVTCNRCASLMNHCKGVKIGKAKVLK